MNARPSPVSSTGCESDALIFLSPKPPQQFAHPFAKCSQAFADPRTDAGPSGDPFAVRSPFANTLRTNLRTDGKGIIYLKGQNVYTYIIFIYPCTCVRTSTPSARREASRGACHHARPRARTRDRRKPGARGGKAGNDSRVVCPRTPGKFHGAAGAAFRTRRPAPSTCRRTRRRAPPARRATPSRPSPRG